MREKQKLNLKNGFQVILLAVLSIGVINCSSVKSPESESLKSILDYAKRLYANEDYADAILELEKLTYKSRATEYEDDVLFYLGQSYYKSEQFLLAADVFKRLVQTIPSTSYQKIAYFQLGMSYYNMSPRYSLDQKYTRLAIDQLQIYIDGFPVPDSASVAEQIAELESYSKEDKSSPAYQKILKRLRAQYGTLDTVMQAEKMIRTCRNKLAKKSFETAKQYISLRSYKAATIYFDEVILSYSDSPFYEQALIGKIDVLMIRKQWNDALNTINKFKDRFPEKATEVEDEYNDIMKELRKEERVAIN